MRLPLPALLLALGLSMVRFGALGALVGCEAASDTLAPRRAAPGTIGTGDLDSGPRVPAEIKARELFDALFPALNQACGAGCHDTGGAQSPKWLDAEGPYKAIKTYRGIIVKDPGTSILVTKMPHYRVLEGALRTRVIDWLSAEALAVEGKVLLSTDAFEVLAGANTVDISKGGKGVDGARLTFDARISGAILTMSKLAVVAPAATGVRVAYPVFYAVPPAGAEIADESMSNVDQTFAAGKSGPLGPGILILTRFPAGSKMRVAFTTLEPAVVAPPDAGGGGGCKQLPVFVSSAKPVLQSCVGCHGGGNAAATGAMSLATYANDDARTCAQALTKVTLADKPKSPILLAPQRQGGFATHPAVGGLAGDYAAKMNAWIGVEN